MEVDANGTRLWYEIDGDPSAHRTVILVHGGPGGYDHSYFKPDFARLTEHARVVYLDLRGHGRSEWGNAEDWSLELCAEDVHAFCDAVGIERPVLFGHSMGAPIVLLYGIRHPGRAHALALLGGFARFDVPRLVEGFRRVAGDEVAAIAERSYRGEAVPNEEWSRVIAAFGPNRPTREQYARMPRNAELNEHGMEVMRHVDFVGDLGRVETPTLVAVGELDPVTPIEASEEIVAAVPNARLEVIEGAGHFSWLDAPDRFWPLLLNLLDDSSATPVAS